MIGSKITSKYRDKALFATKYTASALGVVFALFILSYIPTSSISQDHYRDRNIGPSISVSSELWVVLGVLWLAVFFKPRYFIFLVRILPLNQITLFKLS